MFTSNMASGSISSISAGMQWDANGNYTGFDNEAYGNAFSNSMVGEGAMRSYFSSMIQTGIGSTINYGFEGEFKGLLNNRYADSEAFKSVVTNGLTAGAEFAMFGDTSINILNTSMFGLPGSQGLLSLNLSEDGIRGSIGGGGLDMNMGNMWKAARVGSIFSQNNAMENSGFDDDGLVAGRVLWSDGIDQTSKLLDELTSGDAVLNRDTLSSGVAKTTLIDGVKQIDLSKITEGDLGLMLGVILSQEAMRDGVKGTEQEQAIETFRSVLIHSIVASMVGNTYGMGSLDASVIADIKALQSGDMDAFTQYALGKFDGTEDNWKLMENGSLAYDGDGWLKDSNGNYILDKNGKKIGADGVQGGLQNILGIKNREAVAMLRDQSFENRGKEGSWWTHDGNMGASITSENDKYFGIYNNSLTQHNTLNIYNNLVDGGFMSLSADYISKQTELNNTGWWHPFKRSALKDELTAMTKYISYGEYKGDNFIRGMPNVTGSNNLNEYPVSTLYGATSTNGRNLTHRGLDLATPIGTELYPFIWNNDTKVRVADEEPNSKQGNHIITKTPLSYTFKGKSVSEDLFTRYLHLDSMSVIKDKSAISSTLLGKTGNSGLWDGKPYASHLHIDMYTNNQSPYINYLNMQNSSNSISYENNSYNDPFLFLDQDLYKINDDAYSYNF